MEYKKRIFFLDKAPNQLSNFRTKNWIEIYDDSSRRYTANSHIKLRTLILKKILCDYSDADLYVKEK